MARTLIATNELVCLHVSARRLFIKSNQVKYIRKTVTAVRYGSSGPNITQRRLLRRKAHRSRIASGYLHFLQSRNQTVA